MRLSSQPEQIGPYRVIAPLGTGGMASVYRAERIGEQGFRKVVALKRMHPRFRQDSRLEARFVAEARTNARLVHPNLVQVLDFGTVATPEGGERYLAMELVEGITLAQLLTRLGELRDRMPVAHALAIVSQCAAALDYVHRRTDDAGQPLGIVHRDVSPQNVLLSWDGEVKVSDFGLAKSADHEMMTTIGTRLGKIAYMSPEQLDGVWVDARTDVWALGTVLWECLAQRRMVPGDVLQAAMMIKAGVFEAPSRIRPDVPAEIDDVVARALRPNADARLASARELARVARTALHRMEPGFGAEDLAELLASCFPER
ncbi:serine/threonine-protein kinase [Sandaracinus amylolyticus]|uniref:Serine/threonine protein kinase n=1 Tax=Sandaracinus amylolyticus TaxID=927083 RepID=A0A0F6W4E2_9BACT|nr:serine/threonine-protein kinase [Sandaracinus amylolyticus]AKF07200.1 serine/threonine protein kinase [Sandaracinus amylolyticus]